MGNTMTLIVLRPSVCRQPNQTVHSYSIHPTSKRYLLLKWLNKTLHNLGFENLASIYYIHAIQIMSDEKIERFIYPSELLNIPSNASTQEPFTTF